MKEHKKKFERLIKHNNDNYINNIKPIEFHYNKNNSTTEGTYTLKRTNNAHTICTNIYPEHFKHKSTNYIDTINKKWFFNLTDKEIPPDVTKLLQLGNKFCLPVTNKKEAIHEFIKDFEANTKQHNIKNKATIRNLIFPQLYHFLHSNNPTNNLHSQLTNLHQKTRKFCRLNPDIIFTNADKGNITVAINKKLYIEKVEELLNDNNTYTKINKNPASKIEKSLNNILKEWLNNNYISKKEYYSLHSSDSLLPKAYGLPKIHKPNTPFRIIVSSVNTSLYAIGKYIHQILSQSLPKPNSSINNSFELRNILSEKSLDRSCVLVSLDVISLFTNTPLDLAIEGVANRWEHIEKFTKIPKDNFIATIKFILSSTYFTFNKVTYKQTFGTPMGSPLSPIIADIVMQDLENKILNTMDYPISLYYRYVDDIIMAAPKDCVPNIFDNFNNQHERLKFTMDYDEERATNFLDLSIKINNNKFQINWFHKVTFSGRLLSFHSGHPICHKQGIIFNLVDRAILLSDPSFHQNNLELCINMLLDNGYPLDFIFRNVNQRIRTLVINKLNFPANRLNETNGTDKKFVAIPYIKNISDMTASTLNRSKFSVGYRCLNKLDKYIKVHKDKNTNLIDSNIVYKISCKDCNASYVGQSKRQLGTRLKEHINNKKLDHTKHSVITNHIIENNHNFDWENVKILDRERNYYKRFISEMLHIKEQKNGINLNKDTDLLDDVYYDLLKELSDDF